MSPLRALAALFVSAAVLGAQSGPIIVDADAGSDDVMAVSPLLSHPGVRINAITVVNGMAHVEAGARNMGRLLDLAGRRDVPVFAGREHPLRGNHEFPAEWRKISDNFPILTIFPPRPPEHKPASDYLVERLRHSPEAVRILALGPLSNIAEAPQAASIVFRSSIPIRLIALDATNKVKIDSECLIQFAESPHSRLGFVVWGVLEADSETIQQGIFYARDPLAAEDGSQEGRTAETPGRPNSMVALDANAGGFPRFFLDAFTTSERVTVP